MLPSLNPEPAAVRFRRGFTLTEVLVAMAIFVTVISGVFALYTGAVTTVLRGLNDIDNQAEARTAMAVLQSDINTAYTGVEFGDPNQFYGRPEGFMYVGTLSSGEIGRVTYVINPHASTITFTSTIVESYGDTLGRASLQAEEAGKAAARARGLGDYAASAAARGIADQMLAAFRSAYPEPIDPTPADNYNETYFEFPVIVRTYALMRFEEPDRRDLDTFDALDDNIIWPYIDPIEPLRDTPGDADQTPSGLLYDYLLTAIGGPNPATDMRALAQTVFSANNAASYSGNYAQLHAIDGTVVEKLIDSRRREYWIRLLADDRSIVAANAVDPGAFGFSPRFWTNDPNDTSGKPFARNYIMSERILNRAILLNPDNGQPFTFFANSTDTGPVQLTEVDGLKVPGIFSYGFDQAEFAESNTLAGFMNSLERMSEGYTDFRNSPNPVQLLNFDRELQNAISGGVSAAEYFGSPMNPRLPSLVQVRFWIADEKVLPNAPDFRRLFTQLIQVPAGAARDISATRTAQAR